MAVPESLERRRVLYTGHVQGVGFRYTTQRIAQAFAVTGFVRNLSNGSVELVAEGSPAELDRFLADVALKMATNIDHAECRRETPAGAFESFVIA
jgi:acylphosphatase